MNEDFVTPDHNERRFCDLLNTINEDFVTPALNTINEDFVTAEHLISEP